MLTTAKTYWPACKRSFNFAPLSRPPGFKEEPDTPFRFVDPILQQACRGYVVLFVAQVMNFTHTGKHRLVVVAQFGDLWQGYWRKLRANDVLVVDGWENAYYARFSGAAGSKGKRPVVVSYASSPPAEVIFRDPRPADAPANK